MKLFRKHRFLKVFFPCLLVLAIFTGCMRNDSADSASKIAPIPEKLKLNSDGIPVLKVYSTEDEDIIEMDIESYVMGVVAGEMKNSWPLEALKAQAILARTYTMKFVSSKDSAYKGADISTDIHEAQAYNAGAINDNVREAVNQTRGLVMLADGELAHAWFHAHSGGKTELPSKSLEYKEDLAYLSVVDSPESDKAPADVQEWTAAFSKDEIIKACNDSGLKIEQIESFEIGDRGESGRAVNFLVNGKTVSAPGFRLQIGASKLKSTLIDSIQMKDSSIVFKGRGYGHGVGMAQWGAYRMAEEGKTAEEIIEHYYKGIDLVEMW